MSLISQKRKKQIICDICVISRANPNLPQAKYFPCFCASVANSFLPQAESLNNPFKSVQTLANPSAAGRI